MSKFELWYPLKNPFYITQLFGENKAPFYRELGMLGHNGVDFRAYDGQSIRAAHEGIVTFTGEDGSGGLGVVVRTEQQYEYNGQEVYFKSIYWHFKPNSFKVKAGDRVKVGDILALADNTGMSRGTHLHFGLKPVLKGEEDWAWFNFEQNNGYFGAIDPNPYWNKYFAEDNVFILNTMSALIVLLNKLKELLLKQRSLNYR